MKFKIPIVIEQLNRKTDEWEVLIPLLRANINKKSADSTYLAAAAEQNKVQLVFDVRYHPSLESIRYKKQLYRIRYDGQTFNIGDYDDYMERHRTIRLLGVST